MQPKSDAELLREYADRGSEAAFTELVSRHTDLVYSAAVRQLGSADGARDVAQNVFTALALKAKPVSAKLGAAASLVGWLYRGTRYVALNARRDEQRRQMRERQAMEQLDTAGGTLDWEQIRPLLDEAMETLSGADREAVLLRYFKNQDLRAVGTALGVSDDTAQKRVSRAVDRLRDFLAKRGLAISGSALAAALSANAVQAAPAGMTVTISNTAILAGAAAPTAAALVLTKTITMTTVQKALLAATLVATVGTATYEVRQTAGLQTELRTLRQQQAPMAEQLATLGRERDELANRLAALGSENQRLNRETAELLKLRGELARRRRDSQALEALKARTVNDQSVTLVNSWLGRVERLKQRLQEHPEASIPELQALSQSDWLSATQGELNSEKEFRRALSQLRGLAESKYMRQMVPALIQYAQENGGRPPTDLLQVKDRFKPPIEDAILQRYEIMPAEKLPLAHVEMEGWVVTQKAAVDLECDHRLAAGPAGWASGSFEESEMIKTLLPALKAYCSANSGNMPTEPSQIEPYLTTPQERAVLQNAAAMFAREEPEHRARDLRDLKRLVK